MNKIALAYFTIEDNYLVFTRTNYFDDSTESIEKAKAEKELARLQAINPTIKLKIATRYDVITMQKEGKSLLFLFVLNRTLGLVSELLYHTTSQLVKRKSVKK